MSMIISGSIDLSKIDKSKIVEGKNGGKFYNISIVVNDEKDKYGNDAGITAGQTKEEREAKAKKTYIGNGKVVWRGGGNTVAPSGDIKVPASFNDGSELPF